MGCYAGNTDSYLSQSDQTKVADAVKKYRLWSLSKEGDPGRTPALDLNFAENKSLVDDISGSNLITFTRSSAATYVGADGVIKSMGLNFARNSESLNSWANNGNAISISADSATAPDGTLTADVLSQTAVTAAARWVSSRTATYTAGVTYTLSIWLKKISGTDSQPTINLWVNTGTTQSVGTITTEWVRYSKSFTPASTISSQTFTGLDIGWNDQGGANNFTFAAWGFQVEVGSSATEYAKTTSTDNSAPRFDHDPVTGESLGLLIEESRTNVFLNSKSFSGQSTASNTGSTGQIYWGFSGSGTLTTNAATAPDGTNTASLVSFSVSNAYIFSNAAHAPSSLQGSRICLSMFAKPHPNNSSYSFTLRQGGGSDYDVTFNLDPNGSSQTLTNGYSIKYPNGWYRVVINKNVTSGGALLFYWANRTTDTYYVWGAQGENGAFATTYIPTTSSEVTRTPDLTSITGSNLTSWYNVSEGTLYVDYKGEVPVDATGGYFGSNVNGWGVFSNGSNITNKGRTDFAPDRGGYTISNSQVSLYRGAISQSDIVGKTSYAVNGTLYATDADRLGPYTTPSGFSVSAADVGSASQTKGSFTVKRTMYWGLKLSNSTLQSITQ